MFSFIDLNLIILVTFDIIFNTLVMFQHHKKRDERRHARTRKKEALKLDVACCMMT